MTVITVIGRGHSGTRAISHTLSRSKVFMGARINRTGDLVPATSMYEACRVLARSVRWLGGLRWDFSALHTMPIPVEFTSLIESYLASVLESPAANKGWKIPETTLVFPWIVRLFPDIKYIHWVRNPRDNILSRHPTDDLRTFGIDYPDPDELLSPEELELARNTVTRDHKNQDQTVDGPTELRQRMRRAISWRYQYEIVKATPEPRHWMRVRLEDFVLDQEGTLDRLEDYLGLPLARIAVRTAAVGRYTTADGLSYFDLLAEGMQEYGYDISA